MEYLQTTVIHFNANIFPESTNVSVCTIVDPTTVRTRTYERASFQETLACGTGSVACACAARQETGVEAPKVKVGFRKGQSVRVTDGPFVEFVGTVDEINMEKGKVKVLLSLFGQETPVELDFLQIDKL